MIRIDAVAEILRSIVELMVKAPKCVRVTTETSRDTVGRPVTSFGSLDGYLFTELVGIQLLLMSTLGPLLRGERLTGEQLDVVLRQVQAAKGKKGTRTSH